MTTRPPVKRRQPIAGQDPGEDRLLAMIAALASELAVTRERLDTMERLIARAGLLDGDAIEQFAPTPGDMAARDALRQAMIARIFAPLKGDRS